MEGKGEGKPPFVPPAFSLSAPEEEKMGSNGEAFGAREMDMKWKSMPPQTEVYFTIYGSLSTVDYLLHQR